MRRLPIAVAALAVTLGFAAPSVAEPTNNDPKQVSSSLPTFDDCFRLAWVRGVHVELGELDGFNKLCLAGKVPFETGNPSDSIKRSAH